MKMKKQVASVALAAALSCGMLAGCDLVTTDSAKNMSQVIAEVNISSAEDFKEGGKYASFADLVETTTILKREMVANYINVGYQYVQSYGYAAHDAFKLIQESLVNRQILIQYVTVYLLDTGDYDVNAYRNIVNSDSYSSENAKRAAELAFFLTQEEIDKAQYDLRVVINNTIDSQEKSIINAEEKEYTSDVRTTPTGVETANEDYYDVVYKIYSGKNTASECGSYETVEGSTATTRKKAYNSFIATLNSNSLISKGEDVSDFESLEYYQLELRSAYEDAILEKLTDIYEKQAEATLTEEYVKNKFENLVASQEEQFADVSAFESALDSVSDNNFVVYAPNGNYGFVINILLPFSKTQSNFVGSGSDAQSLINRMSFLKNLKATDQRASWFTGEKDYSYTSSDVYGASEYVFFENSFGNDETSKYSNVKNYYGKYAYNGKVEYDEKEGYTLTPNEIDIDGFIGILEGYLGYAGIPAGGSRTLGYYSQTKEDITKEDGSIDYSKFVYYTGRADIGEFNANDVFTVGSTVNKAMSVVNELSFAYNTDTAGLNSYLGYAVSAYNTSFVKEFEYAAQAAVAGGVGTYTVAPSTYGWHVMYCTFSYADVTPYSFDWNQIETEGSFSNLYYESLKSAAVSGYSSAMQTLAINSYATCSTTYDERWADLPGLVS